MVSYKFYFFVKPGAQSPRGFSALARLYYLARPTKTAMLRRLQHRKMQFYSCLPFDSFVQYSCGWLFGIRRSQLPAIAAFLACKIKAFQTMKCCSAKQCYAVVKPGAGEGLPYETDGDPRRVAQGCKFWILVSLRVFRAEEKRNRNQIFFLAVSFRGQNLLKPRLDWSPIGITKSLSHAQMVSFRGQIQNFRRASPSVSYGSPPPGCKVQFRHVLSQRLLPMGFFLRNKPGEKCQTI